MKQLIRTNIFETNSSSTHTLVIFKEKKSAIDLKANIPIIDEATNYTNHPEDILAYIYTIALTSHDWDLLNKIKEEFPNCIFQRPQWDLPFESETGFYDDIEVISFCELINSSLICYFDSDARIIIKDHLKDFVFNGEFFNTFDGCYEYDCIPYLHNVAEEDIQKFIDEKIELTLTGY